MNLPNILTMVRIALIPVFMILAGMDNRMAQLAAVAVYAIACISDALDGHIARKYNLITDFGKFMDPIADKLLVNTLFIILTGMGRIHWLVTVIMVSRDIIVDVIRLIMVERGTVIAASIWGKLKTVAQMIALILVLALPAPDGHWLNITTDILTYIAAFISLMSGFDYFWKNKKVLLEDVLS